MKQPRFLTDGMLGKLTRWLRLLGYDVEYRRAFSDDELIQLATEESRILLTRDTQLIRRARRRGIQTVAIRGRSNAEDVADIAAQLGLTLDLHTEESRCPKCDGTLTWVEKRSVEQRLPPRTFEAYEDFWKCKGCGQIYWRGAHWKNIQRFVDETNSIIKAREKNPSSQ